VSEIYDNILSEGALTILCTNHLSKICPYGRMAKNSLFSSRPYGVWDRMGTTTSLVLHKIQHNS